jgi:prevent-host-death family protein
MAFVGIRELSHATSRVIRDFEETQEPVIITREGKPIGALVPVSERQVEDIVLATAPEFRPEPRDAGEPREPQSLTEYAIEQGVIDAPEAETEQSAAADNAELADLSAIAAEAELQPLFAILDPSLAAQALTTAATELGAVNGEAIAAIKAPPPEAGEIIEVTNLNASAYGHLFRRYFQSSLWKAPTSETVREAGEAAGKVLRGLNDSVRDVPDLSLPAYTALFHAVEVAWDAERETAAPEAAAPEAAPAEAPPAPADAVG